MRSEYQAEDIWFGVLGTFECRVEGRPAALRGPRQERLVAYLLLNHGRTVPVSRLVDAVWDGDEPDTAAHQVRKMTSDFRHRIPAAAGLLETVGVGYRISLPGEALDLEVFNSELESARRAYSGVEPRAALPHLRRALSMWRGPVLDGEGGLAISTVNTAIEERRLTAFEQFCAIRLDVGEIGALIGDLRQAVDDYPLREALRGLLMRALYLAGRQTEALEEYSAIRSLLHDEHGLEPAATISALQQRILRNDPTLSSPMVNDSVVLASSTIVGSSYPPPQSSPTTLPYDVADFTGREPELAELLTAGQITDRQAGRLRIVVIDGMGGSGKTALAVHAAHRLRESYPDGQLYLDMRGFSPSASPVDTHAALGILLGALGVPGTEIPNDTATRIARWRAESSGRRFLLLLDDARSTAQVRDLLPNSSASLVVVTSRVRLSGLDGVISVNLAALTAAEGVAMLERLLGRRRVQAEPVAAQRLVDLCARLPLALRITASRLQCLPHWPMSRLADRLADESRKLEELQVDDRSVLAIVRSSYEALTHTQREALRAICLHPGESLDIGVIAALLGANTFTAEDAVESLLNSHLLESRSADHYAVHGLVATYVRSTRDSATAAADDLALARAVSYYRAVTSRAADAISPNRAVLDLGCPPYQGDMPEVDEREAALAWFGAEYRNVLSVLRLAMGFDLHAFVGEASRNLGFYLHSVGRAEVFLEASLIAVEAARAGDHPPLLRAALVNVANAYWLTGQYRLGLGYVQEALTVAEACADEVGRAVCLGRLGMLYACLDDYPRATSYLEEAIVANRSVGVEKEIASAQTNLSVVCINMGEFARARTLAGTAKDAPPGVLTVHDRILATINYANAQNGTGETEAALITLKRADDMDRAAGGTKLSGIIAARAMSFCCAVGLTGAADQYAMQARDVIGARGLAVVHRVTILNLLGTYELKQGTAARAREDFAGALQSIGELEMPLETALALSGLAEAEAALGGGTTSTSSKNRENAEKIFDRIGVPNALRRAF